MVFSRPEFVFVLHLTAQRVPPLHLLGLVLENAVAIGEGLIHVRLSCRRIVSSRARLCHFNRDLLGVIEAWLCAIKRWRYKVTFVHQIALVSAWSVQIFNHRYCGPLGRIGFVAANAEGADCLIEVVIVQNWFKTPVNCSGPQDTALKDSVGSELIHLLV